MPINKIVSSFDEAVADIHDGAVLMLGGFGTAASCPSLLMEAVARKGVINLTTVSNTTGFGPDVGKALGFRFFEDHEVLFRNGCVKKAIVSVPVNHRIVTTFEKLAREGKVEWEMVAQGTLAERIRAAKAGIGAFYVPVGMETAIEDGKEKRVINGLEHLLEYAIMADFALIKAYKGDRWGNLVYRGTSRTFNATMAGAAKVTIAEVEKVVELGALDPEAIVTPGVFVDRVVERPREE